MVRLSSVEVANYRPFRDMTKVTFSDGMNIIVGENNVGKSTVFRAIDTSVTGSQFSQYDPHDKTRPADLLVRLNLLLNDTELDTVVQKLLGGPIETTKLPSELKAVTVSKSFSSHSIRFGQLYFFIQQDLGSLGFFSSQVPDGFQIGRIRTGKQVPGAQALRKALSEPSGKWIDSFSAGEKNGISDVDTVGWKFENDICEVFRTRVLSAIKNFSEIRLRPEGKGGQYSRHAGGEREAEVRESLDGSLVADVLHGLKNGNMEAQDKWEGIKLEFHELFPTLEMQLSWPANINNPKIFIVNRKTNLEAPIDAVGAGVGQTITLLTHLIAFEEGVIGIDMPEQHFHPHAQRALLKKLSEYANHTQIILVTHSPTFVTPAFLENLSIMRTVGENVSISQILAGYFTSDEKHKLEQHLDIWGRELFFSRVVLAVEGPTEFGAFPVFASSLGIDFDKLGITVSTMCSKDELFLLVKTLRGFSIPYLAVCDRNALQNIEGQIQVSSRKIRTSSVISQLSNLDLLSEEDVRLVEEFEPQDVNANQYSEEAFDRLREVARKHDVLVLSHDFDEILEKSISQAVLEQAAQLPDSKVIRGKFLAQQIVNEGSMPGEVKEIVDFLEKKAKPPT